MGVEFSTSLAPAVEAIVSVRTGSMMIATLSGDEAGNAARQGRQRDQASAGAVRRLMIAVDQRVVNRRGAIASQTVAANAVTSAGEGRHAVRLSSGGLAFNALDHLGVLFA